MAGCPLIHAADSRLARCRCSAFGGCVVATGTALFEDHRIASRVEVMSVVARPSLPESALHWLVGAEPVRVVALSCSKGIIHRLVEQGHGLLVVEPDVQQCLRLLAGQPPSEALFPMVARADELPLQPCSAQVVLLGGPWRAQPGRPRINAHFAHDQISRTLQPGGWVAGWQVVRDDTVPWVRRLISLMRTIDPDAMSGTAATDHEDLLSSKYFPRIERREFRLWAPVTRRGLVEMVSGQRSVSSLTEATRRHLISEVNQIVDSASRMSELRLPYQMRCWRAHVDHEELTQPIAFGDGALIIPI